MDKNRLPKQALQYKPKRQRNIGRPRKRWRDQLHLEDQGTGNTPNPSGRWWWYVHKRLCSLKGFRFSRKGIFCLNIYRRWTSLTLWIILNYIHFNFVDKIKIFQGYNSVLYIVTIMLRGLMPYPYSSRVSLCLSIFDSVKVCSISN